MKKTIFIVVSMFAFIMCVNHLNAQVRVTDEGYLQVDYSTTTSGQSLTFGDNPNPSVLRGRWAMEYYDYGLNFWIPWPNAGSANNLLFLSDVDGFVGINNNLPSYELDVNGDIGYTGTLWNYSDKRLKSDIKNVEGSLEKVKLLNGKSYKMKRSKPKKYDLNSVTDEVKRKTIEAEMARYNDSIPEEDRIGFIAQELKSVFPELVSEDGDGLMAVNYIGLIPILVEAIKELEARVETLENDCCGSKSNESNLKSTHLGPSFGDAKLYQNNPNPFSAETTIGFKIPTEIHSAQLHICNMVGTLIKTIPINQRGQGQVSLFGNELTAGMYLYSLVCNGQIIDTKNMLLTE